MYSQKKERNVVILGKVGSGKKTLGNHIAGKAIFNCASALGVRSVGHYHGKYESKDTLYQILTVDTEGLQTGYKDPMPYIKKFKTIHLIVFVIANGRYTDESHRSLVTATSNLPPQAKSLCALVITHCEGLAKEQLRDIVAEFRADVRTSQVVALMGMGIFTVGFPDTSKLPPQLTQIYKTGIDADEKTIRQLVNDSPYEWNVSTLKGQAVQRSHSNQRSAPYHKASQRPRESSSFQQPGGSPFQYEASFQQGASPFQQEASFQGASPFQQGASFQPEAPSPFNEGSFQEDSSGRQDHPLVDLSDSSHSTIHPEGASQFQGQASPFWNAASVQEAAGRQDSSQAPLVDLSDPFQPTVSMDVDTNTRSVILLGTVGSGKRTLINHIANEELLKSEGSTTSMTRDATVHHAQFTREGIAHYMLAIDTDSVQSEYKSPLPLIRQKLPNVNLIIFVMAYGRHTGESHEPLVNIVKNLDCHASSICALAITHCEQIKASQRRDMIARIRVDKRLLRIAAFMGKGIYAVGFPNVSNSMPCDVKTTYGKAIDEDERALRELVRNCDYHLSVESLPTKFQHHQYQRNPCTEVLESQIKCISQ